ncbi:MAG: hypothetical protein ACLQMF_07255 [Rectinemataceae bacterium]
MVEEEQEKTRVHLIHDLRVDRCICNVLSELLEQLGEEGVAEEGLPLGVTLVGMSGILEGVARNIEGTERILGKWEPPP